jgi:hypothetical protein
MQLMTQRIKAAVANQQEAAPGMPATSGLQSPAMEQGAAEGPLSMDVINQELQTMMQNNPQMVQELRAELTALMQSGELTPQELNQAVQLAQAALQNPEIYPQLRAFAIEQGIGTEEDIPQEYDQGMLIMMVIAGRALQEGGGGQGQGQMPVPSFQEGGPVVGKMPGAPVVAEVHDGEFVIPSDVVRRIGEEKLEKMIESARNPKAKTNAGLSKPQ